MIPRQPISSNLFAEGLHTSGVRSIEKRNHLASGSKNIMMTADFKPNVVKRPAIQSGKLGSQVLMPVSDGYGGLGNYSENGAIGSITKVLAALFFSGSGLLYYNGASLSSTGSSILQIKLLSGGAYGTAYQAGLSQPLAPSLQLASSLGTGFEGRLKAGSYSARVHKIRSATGARSVASEPSNIIISTESNGVGKSAIVGMPAVDTNGGDAWGVNVTPRRFGSTGPHFLYREVLETELATIDGIPRAVELEWTDGDLVGNPLAPIESFAPPTCVFSGALGECFFVDGAYGDLTLGVTAGNGGSTIAMSLLNRPEEFPKDWLLFPPEAPTALIRGGEGFYYRFGKNSMGVLSFVGGEPPLAFQLYWANTGISYPHNACVAEGGRLYAKTGNRGLVRIGAGGTIETDWANPVLEEIAQMDDEGVVLGWDENSQSLCVFHETDVYIFNSSIERWGYQDLSGIVSGNVVSAVTDGGNLYFACKDTIGTDLDLYQFNAGTGTVEVHQRTDWHVSNGETDTIRQIDIQMRADTLNPVEVKLYGNEDESTPILTRSVTPQKTGFVRLQSLRLSVPNLRSFQIDLKQESNGGDMGFELVDVFGMTRGLSR